jgi:hypothetical protein
MLQLFLLQNHPTEHTCELRHRLQLMIISVMFAQPFASTYDSSDGNPSPAQQQGDDLSVDDFDCSDVVVDLG